VQVIYKVGDVVVSHNGKAYQALQQNQAQVGREPPQVPALWKQL
jgi:hypothetical protein